MTPDAALHSIVDPQASLDEDAAYAAFLARDRTADGRFVIAVHSTRIYCKPSCAARRPKRENVSFFTDSAAARAAGYRACLRCCPDDVGRDRTAVKRAIELIEAAEGAPLLEVLADAVGYAPHHFHRLFKREMGVTPAAYARACRARRLNEMLKQEAHVTDAIYDAGYAAPSRAYADARDRLGMAPKTWKNGGAGESIRHAVTETSLGSLLVAATDKGLCRIAFDETEADLRARFPNAHIVAPDPAFAEMLSAVVAAVDDPARGADLPLDARGTAFQQAVWQILRSIPAGETRSYAQIAALVGRPAAVRAAGSACGDNQLAILVPCHRVLRSDGGLGGYAWGLDRKKALLAMESGK